jgi:UDP-N-acetylglucosamine:LPS N-acetylglucosamine transferase
LINASDAVIGKAGYSTLAEVYQAGVPFGYVPRARFRESPALIEYIQKEMSGLPISEAQFADHRWLSSLPDLFSLPRLQRDGVDGAEQAARFIYGLLA